MLRSLVLALLIVNFGFFAWAHGWLRSWIDVQPGGQREPQRLTAQLHAEQIEVLEPGELAQNHALKRRVLEVNSAVASAASAASTASEPPSAAEAGICVEAGPFNADDASSVDKLLRPLLPAASWTRQSIPISGQWMVYMGPYPDDDLFDRKVTELKRIKGLAFDEVRSGAYAKGISLGRFTTDAEADTRLNALRQRGIRTARVVTIRPPGQVQYLRINGANEAMQVTLSGLKLPQGKSFTACRS